MLFIRNTSEPHPDEPYVVSLDLLSRRAFLLRPTAPGSTPPRLFRPHGTQTGSGRLLRRTARRAFPFGGRLQDPVRRREGDPRPRRRLGGTGEREPRRLRQGALPAASQRLHHRVRPPKRFCPEDRLGSPRPAICRAQLRREHRNPRRGNPGRKGRTRRLVGQHRRVDGAAPALRGAPHAGQPGDEPAALRLFGGRPPGPDLKRALPHEPRRVGLAGNPLRTAPHRL